MTSHSAPAQESFVALRQDVQVVLDDTRRAEQQGCFQLLPIDSIDGWAEQPRRTLNAGALEELTESVQRHGVLQPIRVRTSGLRYVIVAGHRRLLAARRAGLAHIPAIVIEIDDGQALIEALIENVQREDLNAVDRGAALRRLRVNLGAQSWEEVGRIIGISRRHVYHLLNIGALPEPIREDIQAGQVNEKHGRALLRLRDYPDLQMELWRRILQQHMSGEDALAEAMDVLARRSGANGQRERPVIRRETVATLEELVGSLLRMLPHAPMKSIRPLRKQLETLSWRLSEILNDAFYAEEQEAVPRNRRATVP